MEDKSEYIIKPQVLWHHQNQSYYFHTVNKIDFAPKHH